MCQRTAEKLMQNPVIMLVRDASAQIKVQTILYAEVNHMDLI